MHNLYLLQDVDHSQSGPPTPVPSKNRSSRSRKVNDDMDNDVLTTAVSSLNELVKSHTASQQELKFKEFHAELDQILGQLPFMDATKLSMDIMRQANEYMQKYIDDNSFELLTV